MSSSNHTSLVVVQWNDWEGDGKQFCSLNESASECEIEGVVIASRESTYGAYFNVRMDTNFTTREVVVDYLGLSSLHIKQISFGEWYDCLRDQPLPMLQGCIDIDIAVTPLTNTLPIRRLRLGAGESVELDIAYIPLPSEIDGHFLPRPVKERYTCKIPDYLYLYEGIFRKFQATLEVDQRGIVKDYPGTFRRIYRANEDYKKPS